MFRLSKLADYGIVIMTNLARKPDRQFSAADIATDSLIPQPTVSKILKMLTRADLLTSHRGLGAATACRVPAARSRSPR